MRVVVRIGGRTRIPWELPASRFRRRPLPFVKGGRRTMYELTAAIAATGREVELRGPIDEEVFEGICSAAGARPALDPHPRLPSIDDLVIVPEGWPHPLYAPYGLSGARCVVMLLGPPGLTGWPFTNAPWEKPDPITVDPAAVGRPEHFRAIVGLGFELWTHSRGIESAALEAGVGCQYLGSGQPRSFPDPPEKEADLVVLENNRWAPLAIEAAERTGRSLLRIPTADHEDVLHALGSARLLVWPSRVEGHSRIQVEARAMGTVPVALASNRFAEGLSSESGAVVVDSLDEMAPAIERLLEEPERLARLSGVARDTARAQVDWSEYVARVDAALSRPASRRDGAAARDQVYRELAGNEYRLRSRLRASTSANGRPPGGLARGRALLDALRPRAAAEEGRTPGPLAATRRSRAGDGRSAVYVAGGYMPRGGGYMAYHLGRIAANRLGRPCRVVIMKDETPDHGRWAYPERFEAISRREMEAEIGEHDLLVANPSFSRSQFGLRLPGHKLMYVQGFGRLPELDGFFDAYVCASEFLQDLLLRIYDIEAPVIPPFIHVDRVPDGPPWEERPAGTILVSAKAAGESLLDRLSTIMRRDHPSAPFSVTVVHSMPHEELLEGMSQHRYFLTLSPREGFGLTQLEAMAAGCTVVGFHGGGGAHFMRPGDNCEAAAYPDLEALAGRLTGVLANDTYARSLAAQGRRTAADYDLVRFEERWGEFLERFEKSPAVPA